MTHVEEAIERLKKFGRLCKIAKIVPILGFSGGKDSAVVYDLAKRSGIEFIPRFNHTFEPPEVLKFIKEVYPEVEWFRGRNVGFLENIRVNHKGYLPTAYTAYCCDEYKHNSKFAPRAVITGVRRAESFKRRERNVLNIKSTKQPLKSEGVNLLDYFLRNAFRKGHLLS